MYRSSRRFVGNVPLSAGERTTLKLVNGARNKFITVIARATVTVTVGAATSLRNRGSVFALFDELGIDENGTDRHIYRGPVLRALSEAAAPSALSAIRAATPVAVYNLEETARIYFQHPLALDPGETAFMERNAAAELRFFATLTAAANQVGRLYVVGGATVTVTNVTLTVVQSWSGPAAGGALPVFIPTARQEVLPVAATSSALSHWLRSNHAIRYIVLSQETTTVGEVQDIINRAVLRGDQFTILGPGSEDIDDIILENEYQQGGAIPANRSHIVLDFQEYGKLSELLEPALQDTNMRFELDVQPSASAGSSQIRVTIVEMTREPGLVRAAADVPFPVRS
jgi:hypothetical protein